MDVYEYLDTHDHMLSNKLSCNTYQEDHSMIACRMQLQLVNLIAPFALQEVNTGKHTWANYFLAAYKVGQACLVQRSRCCLWLTESHTGTPSCITLDGISSACVHFAWLHRASVLVDVCSLARHNWVQQQILCWSFHTRATSKRPGHLLQTMPCVLNKVLLDVLCCCCRVCLSTCTPRASRPLSL